MRIEELIIDGFKSYPVRTHVSGFDSSFNAITGLNGSGKSNILDSICFVLGITNLSAVRASNLQDLIYKRGQAGITKASVTIVFDNSDRATSPVSFENYSSITVTRQIAMGGLSKYLINGHKATQQSVQNLFQSVQLNINNPNFLIMQGKITKVLNMKPQEILSMIEEAAGTRMFEDRKEKAFRTMNKKDMKVKEITAILAEEITPKLDKLREEKRSFLEYQKASTELERLTRLSKAYEYQSLNSKLSSRTNLVTSKRSEISASEKKIEEFSKQIKEVEKELLEIEAKREAELEKGGKLQGLVTKEKEMEHDLVKKKTGLKFKEDNLEEEKKKLGNDRDYLKTLEKNHEEKKKELEELNNNFKEMKESYENSLKELNVKDELLQTLLTGMASNKKKKGDGEDDNQGGYIGALANAKSKEANAITEISQTKLRISHLTKELSSKEPAAKKASKENQGLISELEELKEKLTGLDQEMSKMSWNSEKEVELNERKSTLEKEINDLSEKRDFLKARLGGLDFNYQDPTPGFDRSKVQGLIASLITLPASNASFSTALEIVAGGRLYNVVVSDEKIGSSLLQKGQLKKRVTLIPLNKISANVAPAEKVNAAKSLAPQKVELALELIGYEDEVEKAMKYVFGNTLVCKDSETAKKVTFDQKVRMKSVTMEGDVYDPAGTLSGGSKNQGGGVLLRMTELLNVEKELKAKTEEWKKLDGEMKEGNVEKNKWEVKRREKGMLVHRIELLEGQIKGSNATRVVAEVAALKTSLQELETASEAATQRLEISKASVISLTKELEEFNNNKDSKLDELKAELKKMKSDIQKSSTGVKSRQNEIRTMELETEQSAKDVENQEAKLEEGKKALGNREKEVKDVKVEIEQLQKKFDSLQEALTAERATLSRYDSSLTSLATVLKTKRQSISDLSLLLKQHNHEIEKLETEVKSTEKMLESLVKDFDWIEEEKMDFGKEGTSYDFDKQDMKELRKNCKKLEEQQSGMKKKVNPMVLNMIDSVEKKETSLKQMLSTVLKDKSKIEATIDELDRYKKDALQTTWEKVNGDFGDIFAELLPGNYAKLQPPEGQELTQGLEVKVRLGSVWKASLTELSGGQRSLIALSLIMSLLQFKPAPMYILDEIDAALDLSHTQHIGQLFKSRFSGSQFIVVSLKEGLFTNANVLFRARFRDGTSIVERVGQKGSSASASAGKENESANGNGRAELNVNGGRKKKVANPPRRALAA